MTGGSDNQLGGKAEHAADRPGADGNDYNGFSGAVPGGFVVVSGKAGLFATSGT
jgi:hypothetical protein